MRVYKKYLTASFSSFLIHALIILYLLNFFEITPNNKRILSKPINVNLIFEQTLKEKTQIKKTIETTDNLISNKNNILLEEKRISFESIQKNSLSLNDLLLEENINEELILESEVNYYSSLIIENIQSAWRRPINIPDGLICDLRLKINKNGRIVSVNLIKSSGNIRFDNSAIKAIERVETLSFFSSIPTKIYNENFKNVVITFNPIWKIFL